MSESWQAIADLAADYPRLRIVSSFADLVATKFEHGVNALCWPRTLQADFTALYEALAPGAGMTFIEDEALLDPSLPPAARLAADLILEDLARLRSLDLEPELNCIQDHVLREARPGPVRTDVCSFHVDSATVEADTWLCTYLGASSEGLRNEQAIRRVDIPETRAALLQRYGGPDDHAFEEHLAEHCYDLHYAPQPGASVFPFGIGHLWRIATQHPDAQSPACVHRAPDTGLGQRRILLIS